MREIKLRAWYRGKMYRFVEHHTHPDGSNGVNDMGESIERMFSPGDEVELMQWTGLKDKNGKDIYEGDIVQWSVEIGPKPICTVEWHQGICGWQPFCDYDVDCDGVPTLEDHQWWQIIGNIYETPELAPQVV